MTQTSAVASVLAWVVALVGSTAHATSAPQGTPPAEEPPTVTIPAADGAAGAATSGGSADAARTGPAVPYTPAETLPPLGAEPGGQPGTAGGTPPGAFAGSDANAPVIVPGPAPDDALYAARTRQDRIGRVLAAVTINGRGPFRLVVDTGATRSALSTRVLAKLGLAADANHPVRLRGVTGSRVVPTVYVERLQAGDFVVEGARLPLVEAGVLADADGILGLAGLTEERLEVDFQADRTRLVRSTATRWRQSHTGSRVRGGGSQALRTIGDAGVPALLRVPLTVSRGGLLVVPARVGRVAAKAVIDTGAQRTLGNAALRAALARSGTDPREPNTWVVGATPDVAPGLHVAAPPIKLGDVMISRVALTYGDFHVFESWQMDDEPALLIGMDVLGGVDQLVIDFRRREMLLRN